VRQRACNHHQLLEWTQSRVGLGQPGEALGIFQIKVVERIGRDELAGQRGLAALAWSHKGNHAAAPQGGANQHNVGHADNHRKIVYHENPAVDAGISWYHLEAKRANLACENNRLKETGACGVSKLPTTAPRSSPQSAS